MYHLHAGIDSVIDLFQKLKKQKWQTIYSNILKERGCDRI